MSKRKAKAPTVKNIVDGNNPVQMFQQQMFMVQVDLHIFKILQLIQTNAKFRAGLDKLVRSL